MSIPSELHSIFLSSNGVNNMFDVGSVSSCNLQSTEPLQYPLTYSTHHVQRSNLIDSCNFGNPDDHHDLLAHPSLMPPICNSSLPPHGPPWDRLTRTAPTEKSLMHKMMEKRRRKDMQTVLSRLRSLLPEVNIRGKRAVSDQVLEAVNYIRYMQQKIEDLSTERDKMKADFYERQNVSVEGALFSSNDKFWSNDPRRPGSDGEFPAVKIKSRGSSVEVSINAFKEHIVYSNLLLVSEECGLEVVNVSSSAINKRVFHTIHGKMHDVNDFNIEALCKKFRDLLTANHIQAELRTVSN